MYNIGTSLQYRCSFYLFSETSVYATLVPALWIFDKRWNLKLQMKLACIVQRLCSQFWDDFWGKWKLTLALVRLAWPREPWRWRWAPPWRSWRRSGRRGRKRRRRRIKEQRGGGWGEGRGWQPGGVGGGVVGGGGREQGRGREVLKIRISKER